MRWFVCMYVRKYSDPQFHAGRDGGDGGDGGAKEG